MSKLRPPKCPKIARFWALFSRDGQKDFPKFVLRPYMGYMGDWVCYQALSKLQTAPL